MEEDPREPLIFCPRPIRFVDRTLGQRTQCHRLKLDSKSTGDDASYNFLTRRGRERDRVAENRFRLVKSITAHAKVRGARCEVFPGYNPGFPRLGNHAQRSQTGGHCAPRRLEVLRTLL